MDPQKPKHGTQFLIVKRATRGCQSAPMEVANFKSTETLDLQNICRLCFKEPPKNQMMDMTLIYDTDSDLSYYDCYEICTSKDLRKCLSPEPRSLCKRCAVELEWAYEFHKRVALANHELLEIIKASKYSIIQSEEQEVKNDFTSEVHLLEVEDVEQEPEKQVPSETDKPTDYVSLDDLVLRQRVAGKITCKYCKKEFQNRSRMAKHEMIHLANRPRFECDQCKKMYMTKQALKVHMDSKHRQTGVPCTVCGKVFAIAKALEIHMRYHTGDFPFACDRCDCKFAQRSHLSIHQEVKHNGARFVCEFPSCKKSFTSSSTLRTHECTHTAMPFECAHCQKGFAARTKLRCHIKQKHNKRLSLEDLEGMRKFHIARSKRILSKTSSHCVFK
ncbi:hypothetical protein KR018_012023 [Drosophila ironensis]|nr:hypothetical protein KR018_012023 [Drosophila ironensis]